MTDNDSGSQITPAQVLEILRGRFPGAFPAAGEAARPLKIGIREDLLRAVGETIPRSALLRGLSAYISSLAYQAAVAQGGERVDLAGNPSGPVTERDQAYAAQRVVILQQRQQAKADRRQAHEETLRRHAEQKAERQRSQEKAPSKKAEVPADRDCPAAPLAIPPHPAPAAPAAAVPRPATAKPRSGAASTPVVTVSVKKRRTLSLKPE